MTLKTYYAKLDCYSNNASFNVTVNETYKSFCDFMSHLTGSGVATLVSWNSGSGVLSGSFDSRTYWDGALPFGVGAHSLWRFNATPERNFDWYLYTQVVSGTGAIRQAFNTPISGYADSGDSMVGSSNYRGILVQTAVCFSGSTSFNPWNGSIGDGNGNASQAAGNGARRWISGSNDRTLYVLPRSNNLGGTHATARDNALSFPHVPTIGAAGQPSVTHFICDGDSLLVLRDEYYYGGAGVYGVGYFGPFELRNSLSSSGIAGTPFGFLMHTSRDGEAVTFSTNTAFGDTAGSNATINGGVSVPVRDLTSGSKGAILQVLGSFNSTTYQPNTLLNQYDELPIYVGISEAPYFGMVGQMNTGLVRAVLNVQTQDTTADFKRAIFGGSTTLNFRKISTPWNGAVPPGTSTSRTGSNFTWVQDYG
jgi:hypothetical protein